MGNKTTYEVDLNGMTTKEIQANGGVYTYAYDAGNRLTDITSPEGYARSFTYDSAGNISKETDNLDRTTAYEYDRMHRVTRITDAEGGETSYGYDANGNLSTAVTPLGVEKEGR